MDTILDHLTDYQRNQLLTETSLNATNDFLEQQERLTRFGFTNTGIINGLTFTVSKTNNKISSIKIVNGFGSSIDGYFIHHNYPDGDIEYTKCKPYKFSNIDVNKDFNILSQAPFLRDAAAKPVNSDQIIAYELLPANYSGNEPAVDINTISTLAKPLVALFLELESEGLPECSPTSCDEGGKIKRYKVVPLLIEDFYTDVTLNEIFPVVNTWLNQKDYIKIGRLSGIHDLKFDFNVTGNNPNPLHATALSLVKEVNRVNTLNKIYLSNHITNLINITQPVSSPELFKDIQKDISKFDNIPLQTIPPCPYPSQYFFDFCADLELAINEFVKQYNLVNYKYYTTYAGRKRRFLVLGLTEVTDKDPYRYYSINFFENYGRNSELKKLKSLYERIFVMITKFQEQYPVVYNGLGKGQPYKSAADIKIIPSKTGPSPLGERAIPFYYKRDGNIEKVWRGGENHVPYNININNYNDIQNTQSFLNSNINENNFFRIEGVIGTEAKAAQNNLVTQCKQYNAPFNIICVDWTLILTINQMIYDFNQLIIRITPNGATIDNNTVLELEHHKSKLQGNMYIDVSAFQTFLNLFRPDGSTYNNFNTFKKFFENDEFSKKVPFFWGMEHIGGVYRGGTYILAYINYTLPDGNSKKIVIADFQVPYMIELNLYAHSIPQRCPSDTQITLPIFPWMPAGWTTGIIGIRPGAVRGNVWFDEGTTSEK